MLGFFKGIKAACRRSKAVVVLIVAVVIKIFSVGSLHNDNIFVIGLIVSDNLRLQIRSLLFILDRDKPIAFRCHNLRIELFVLWGERFMLLQIRYKHISSPLQAFYLFTVIILALFLPFANKRAIRGQRVFVKVFDMGDKVALAVANIKPSFIMEIFASDSSGNLKIGLMIPTDIILAFTLSMLLFVQNAKKIVAQSKAQIGISVIKLPVIKGGVFRKSDRELYSVWLFFGRYLNALLFGNDYFQMVVCRIFL